MVEGITALILTYNEGENIQRTLQSLVAVEQVLIIDSFSTDDTVDLARETHPGIQIVSRQFDTHAAQWNFGIDQILTPWVLTLDADYQLRPDLVEEIMGLRPNDGVAGYSARFRYCIWGRCLRATVYPARTVLLRKDTGRYVDEGHTQIWRSTGRVEQLEGYIEHDDRKPLSRWIQSQDRYAQIEAKYLLEQPMGTLAAQDRLRRKIFFAPPMILLYLLFVRGLILDGWPGFFYSFQRTFAELLLSLRLMAYKHGPEKQ